MASSTDMVAAGGSARRPGRIRDSILDTVGDTPLVRLSRIGRGLVPELLAKVELFNPGGSIKDRAALSMIDAAERDGSLRPGGTIVEPTSGNTGTGLAIVARIRGYRVIAVMPDKMSQEKIDLLRAYGAEVVICPTEVAPDDPRSYYSVATRLAAEIPGGFGPNQYHNPANPRAHYESTGPEIWEGTGGRVTHLVVGVGTGGTISGTARYLKERNPDIEVIGVDPVGSIYSGGDVHSYLLEGVGEDFWPTSFDPTLVDRYIRVSDRDAFLTARRLAETEGLLTGGSCGMAVHAALAAAAEITDPAAVVVVILPDSGRAYLSKIYNDGWMRAHGFLERPASTVGDVVEHKGNAGSVPSLIAVRAGDTVREAIALFGRHDVSQLPVLGAAGDAVIGSIDERGLLGRLAGDIELLDTPVGSLMAAPFPAVDTDQAIPEAVALLEESAALLVTDGGRPLGLLTRADLLEALAG